MKTETFMRFWKNRKSRQKQDRNGTPPEILMDKKNIESIFQRQDLILKKLDVQEQIINKQAKQIEGLLDALNNINSALESNNIVLQELVNAYKKGPDLLLN